MSENFVKSIMNETNETLTENGAVAYRTTNSSLLDMFAVIGALRSRPSEEIINKFTKAFAEDQLLAMKMLFYARNIRGGLGERRTFRILIKYMANYHSDVMEKNIDLIPIFGRWDDLYELVGTPLEDSAFALIKNQLDSDLANLEKGKQIKSVINDKCIIIHNCNSYATLHKKEFLNSMVRCGFAIYGWLEGFKPVLKITTEIIQINKIKDATVGYDRTFYAHNKKIAVLPIGYADGFDRRLSNNFKVLVNGEYAKVVGNICMDMCMIDVTNIKKVGIGTKVTILGKDKDKSVTVYDYAKALDTSPYEVFLKFRSKRMDLIEI